MITDQWHWRLSLWNVLSITFLNFVKSLLPPGFGFYQLITSYRRRSFQALNCFPFAKSAAGQFSVWTSDEIWSWCRDPNYEATSIIGQAAAQNRLGKWRTGMEIRTRLGDSWLEETCAFVIVVWLICAFYAHFYLIVRISNESNNFTAYFIQT